MYSFRNLSTRKIGLIFMFNAHKGCYLLAVCCVCTYIVSGYHDYIAIPPPCSLSPRWMRKATLFALSTPPTSECFQGTLTNKNLTRTVSRTMVCVCVCVFLVCAGMYPQWSVVIRSLDKNNLLLGLYNYYANERRD